MSPLVLHLNLSDEAAARMKARTSDTSRTGPALREWLLRRFERTADFGALTPSLFSTPVEVEADVPLLVTALSVLTGLSVEELIDAWASEPEDDGASDAAPATEPRGDGLAPATLGRVAQILDLGETLVEETVADARQRVGTNYPEGAEALKASAEVFGALRILVGLKSPDTTADKQQQRP